MRKCSKCGVEKPLSDFYVRGDRGTPYGSCKLCTCARTGVYAKTNRKKMTELNKRWNRENPEKYKAKYTKANATRYADPAKRFDILLRNAVSQSLAGRRKYRPTFQALGYSREQLIAHIERQFTRGMTWENYGEWHLDHIIPLSSFEYASSEDEGFKLAWAITNLRPLWAEDNLSKRGQRLHLV